MHFPDTCICSPPTSSHISLVQTLVLEMRTNEMFFLWTFMSSSTFLLPKTALDRHRRRVRIQPNVWSPPPLHRWQALKTLESYRRKWFTAENNKCPHLLRKQRRTNQYQCNAKSSHSNFSFIEFRSNYITFLVASFIDFFVSSRRLSISSTRPPSVAEDLGDTVCRICRVWRNVAIEKKSNGNHKYSYPKCSMIWSDYPNTFKQRQSM